MTIDQQLRAFSGLQRARLWLPGCTGLTTLPVGLTVGDGARLDLSGSGIPAVGRDALDYEFRRVVCNGTVYVNAGGRHFTAEQARAHWPEGSECRALAEACLA